MTGEKRLQRSLALLCALLFLMGMIAPTTALAEEPATAETAAESGITIFTEENAVAAASRAMMLLTNDGAQTELDLAQGSVTIYADHATVGTQSYTDPDGYCIFSSAGASGNTITIAGDAPVTLRSIQIKSDNKTPLLVRTGVKSVITLEGSNNFGNGWDDVHTTNIVLENNACLTLTGSGSLTCRESNYKNKLSLGSGAELIVQGCSVYLRSSYVPAVDGSGTLTVDAGYLSLRTDTDHGNGLICNSGVSVVVRNGSTLAVDERTANFGGKSLSLDGSTLKTTGNGRVTVNPGALSIVNSQVDINGTIADSLKADTSGWSGLTFEGNTGTVYGTYTLPDDFAIASNEILTIPQGATLTTEHAITLNGTLINEGELNLPSQKAMTGNGKLTGTGTESFSVVYPEITVPTLVYNGQDRISEITAAIPTSVTLCGKEIPISGHTMEGWVPSYTQNGTPVQQIMDAGTYTVSYTKGDKVESKTFTVNKSGTELDGGLQTDKTSYTYGETITVTAKPVPSATAANSLSMTAPAANQMAMFLGNTQVSEPVDPDAAGVYTMTVETTLLKAGTHTLEARFVDNGNMASMKETLTVQVQRKALTVSSAQVDSKVYDGTGEVSVTGVALDGILASDDVSVDTTGLTGTLSGTGAGTYGEVTLPNMTLTGADKDNYSLTLPTGPVAAGTVTVAPRPVILAWGNDVFTYNGSEQYPAATVENKATAADEVNVTVSGGAINASDTPYTATASGLTGAAAANYTLTNGQNLTRTFTIGKAGTAENKVPTANVLVYNGALQPLVTAGEADGGTLVYSLDEAGPYTESIPAVSDAGTYTVWYKVVGDTNHKDTVPDKVEVNIARKAASVKVDLSTNRLVAGEVLPTVSLTCTGLIEGDSITPSDFTLVGMPKTSEKAGTYTVALSSENQAEIEKLGANYALTFDEAKFTILPETTQVLPEPEVSDGAEDTIYRLEQSEMTEVPDQLSDKYTSIEEIWTSMYEVAVKALPGSTTENTVLHDISLLYSTDDGKTWVTTTSENFPAKGIKVTLPYPAGTNATDYDFVVTHMVSVAVNGLNPGDVETPAVTKTEKGLQFTAYSLSPVTVSWKSISKTDNTASAQAPAATPTPSDNIPYYTCPSCGYHNWTATEAGYRCDNCGYLESVKQLSGYGNVKGIYTPGSNAAATVASTIPQTGDESSPVLWTVLLLVSGLALGGLALRRKAEHSRS